MPIPKTKDVGNIIDFLKNEKPGMARKQKVAIALNVAREAGNKKIKVLQPQLKKSNLR